MDATDEAIVASWEPHVMCMRKLTTTGEWIGVKQRMYNTLIMIGMTEYEYRDGY